jgi:hypothetical protein
MRVTVLLASLIFVVGCQKTNPAPSSTASQTKDEFTVDAPANSEPDYNSAKEEADLLAQLAKDPQDARALLGLARINHVKTMTSSCPRKRPTTCAGLSKLTRLRRRTLRSNSSAR